MPEVLNVVEFVNADEIARELPPFNVESVVFEARRIMLQRIDQLMRERIDFAFETTFSTRSYVIINNSGVQPEQMANGERIGNEVTDQ
ncbi:hypothetical protein [Spirosoma fluminis]